MNTELCTDNHQQDFSMIRGKQTGQAADPRRSAAAARGGWAAATARRRTQSCGCAGAPAASWSRRCWRAGRLPVGLPSSLQPPAGYFNNRVRTHLSNFRQNSCPHGPGGPQSRQRSAAQPLCFRLSPREFAGLKRCSHEASQAAELKVLAITV